MLVLRPLFVLLLLLLLLFLMTIRTNGGTRKNLDVEATVGTPAGGGDAGRLCRE